MNLMDAGSPSVWLAEAIQGATPVKVADEDTDAGAATETEE